MQRDQLTELPDQARTADSICHDRERVVAAIDAATRLAAWCESQRLACTQALQTLVAAPEQVLAGISHADRTIQRATPPKSHPSSVERSPTAGSPPGTSTNSATPCDLLSISGSFSNVPGTTTCTAAGTATIAPSVTCDDDATVTATLTVSDGINTPVVRTTTLTIGNVEPTVSAITITLILRCTRGPQST